MILNINKLINSKLLINSINNKGVNISTIVPSSSDNFDVRDQVLQNSKVKLEKVLINETNKLNDQININNKLNYKLKIKSSSLNKLNNINNNMALKKMMTRQEQDLPNKTNLSLIRKIVKSASKFTTNICNSQYLFFSYGSASSNKVINHQFKEAAKILKLAFLVMGCLISKPIFKIVYTKNRLSEDFKDNANKKIIIQLFYYVKTNLKSYFKRIESKDQSLLSLNSNTHKPYILSGSNNKIENTQSYPIIYHFINKINRRNSKKTQTTLIKYIDKFGYLMDHLTNLFGTEIELQLVRLERPYFDSNILVQNLALESYDYKFGILAEKLFKKLVISKKSKTLKTESVNSEHEIVPSELSGVKVILGGRTFKQKVIPRRTYRWIQKGSLSRAKAQYIETSRFTGKTRRGSYSFTVTVGHVF